ncbi:zinc finger CCCH domain-containing protein 17 [Heracleum sosnowskyi]|uniref:Zinc finger CCCH domain-containing protein 17 n=1 Tax=Heracleum sosnowskyi TaxID=360622 RepID=A0AAD8IGY6_9APIA|nr:zinc finger CCCH domain-containing protein 17 [Heracleum sosnowskyi]
MLGGAQTEAPAQQEEALKRNTDCVYFLASPLTCKKGIECEYRHSDIARLNPRDCWYWLNGNCLNPKCAFRHPPLDGLLEVTTPAVNSVPPSQTVVPVAVQGANVPSKQAVPCIFFQQGYCMKGDMCPFMHSPYSLSLNNKASQSAGATPVSESQNNKKTFGGLGKHTQEQKVLQANAPKSTDFPPQMKSSAVLGKAPLRNEISISGNKPIAAGLDGELPPYSRGNVHSSSNGNLVSRLNRSSQVHTLQDQSNFNVKDAEEVSREPSPGFDVLVDDEINDSEYYPDEDQYGRTGHDGMNFTAANEYDIGRSADYGSVGGVDQDMYHDSRNCDTFERLQGQYDPSERILRGSAHLERRRYPRADSAGRIDGSDLRYHLSKQKRNNGLRSVISRDPSRENHADDRSSRASRRDQLPVHEASSRLRGRIKIPGRSMSPIDRINPRSERESDRSRHLRRLSPERPLGRLRDRIKGSVHEDFGNGRNFRGSSTRRDLIYDNNAGFGGPKSLSELKADGEDYINIDEGENADPEDDYFDEEDDADDFAKKMGVMYS